MIVRIVKMNFFEENIPIFLDKFDAVKEKIRNTEGNQFLELYQDKMLWLKAQESGFKIIERRYLKSLLEGDLICHIFSRNRFAIPFLFLFLA